MSSPRPAAASDTVDRAESSGNRLLTAVVVLGIAFFALLGVGAPLLGGRVFAGTDHLVTRAPYSELTQYAQVTPTNVYVGDTWDSSMPNTILFFDQLRAGEYAQWNPYVAGGVPLGATPNFAVLGPLNLPYLLLPSQLAPGYTKLLEILVAIGATWLFLRRLGLRAAAGLLGGLAFAGSGFMISWTGWPQTRVAAFIPAVFWGAELVVSRRRARDAAVLALAVAAMIFGGFPAVTLQTLATVGIYVVVRVWGQYRHDGDRGVASRSLVGVVAGVAAGAALTAVQLLPWITEMSNAYISGRHQIGSDHLSVASLITSIAPWAAGTAGPTHGPYWFIPVNLVESLSYVGAAALVLAITAVLMARRGRAVLPTGVWTFLVAASAGWFLLIYVGRLPLALLQKLPILFADNYIGRARSILGFLVAVLAGVGVELLLRRRADAAATAGRAGPGERRWRALVLTLVGIAGVLAIGSTWYFAFTSEGGGWSRVGYMWGQLAPGLVLLAVSVALAVLLWRRGRLDPARDSRPMLRWWAASGLAVLVAGQAVWTVQPFWPRPSADTFYPVTDVHTFLEQRLGHDRYAGTTDAMDMSIDTALGLRAATGHAFVERRYGELVRDVPGQPQNLYPTHARFLPEEEALTSPVLDLMATRYAVVALDQPVLGKELPAQLDATTARLDSGVPVTVPLPGTGGVRAVSVTPDEDDDWGPRDSIAVDVRDASGREVARSQRLIRTTVAGAPLMLPVAAEDVAPTAKLTATLTVTAARPLTVRGAGGKVTAGVVFPQDDGLRIAYVGSALVYERLRARPRLRFAGAPVEVADPAARLKLLASGELTPDQVVLEQAPTAGGGTGTAQLVTDGMDEVVARVSARGSGYVVLSDAIQSNWAATVDGVPAPMLRADHAFVAVAVPDGEHTVRFAYVGTGGGLGGWVSAVAAVAVGGTLIMAAVTDLRRRQRVRGNRTTRRGSE
jgi:hypothetical protein